MLLNVRMEFEATTNVTTNVLDISLFSTEKCSNTPCGIFRATYDFQSISPRSETISVCFHLITVNASHAALAFCSPLLTESILLRNDVANDQNPNSKGNCKTEPQLKI